MLGVRTISRSSSCHHADGAIRGPPSRETPGILAGEVAGTSERSKQAHLGAGRTAGFGSMPNMIAIAHTVAAGLLGVTLLAALPGQEYVRWLDDLGDEQLTEAAERSLIAMGPAALRPLAEQLSKWDTATARERKRCLAL